MRTAVAVGAAIAAGRFSRDPMSLLQRGTELLGSSSVLGQVSGLAKPLSAAGKAAAAGVVSRQIDSMGDRIKRRTDALRLDADRTDLDDDQTEPDDQTDLDNQTELDDERGENVRAAKMRDPNGRGANGRGADEDGGNGRAKQAASGPRRESPGDADDGYDDYDDVDDSDEAEDEPTATPRRAPRARTDAGDVSPVRRGGRGAPVRRRVSNR